MQAQQSVNPESQTQMQEHAWKNVFLETFDHKRKYVLFRSSLLLILFLCLVFNCNKIDYSDRQLNDINQVSKKNMSKSDEDEIYCLLLNNLDFDDQGTLLIEDMTETNELIIEDNLDKTLGYVDKSIKEKKLSKQTIQMFKDYNEVSHQLGRIEDCNKIFSIISSNNLAQLFQEDDPWEQISRKYPNFLSIVTFSKIALSIETQEALVYIGNLNGEKSGEGNYYVLRKTNGKWIIQEKINAWVS